MRNRLLAFCVLTVCLIGSLVRSQPVRWEESRDGAGVKAPIESAPGVLLATASGHTSSGAELICYRSVDGGSTWTVSGIIATDPVRNTDLGDAALLQLRNGSLLCSYRRNHHARRAAGRRDYAIEVAASSDNGKSWRHHSVVASARGATGGLWASFLFQASDGVIQCYYDDEATPWQKGYQRHQWLTMKSWDTDAGRWIRPVTVSRAHNPDHLSRDGMCSVVETAPGKLLCVFESVHTSKPWKGTLRSVTSADGGRTWSWKRQERPIVYAPTDHTYNALAPWMIEMTSGPLVCVFVTDEDRDRPDTPATARLDEDVKAVFSFDRGKTWSKQAQTVAAEHPCYLPGIVQLKDGSFASRLVVQYTSHGAPRVIFGRPTEQVDNTSTRN